MEIIWPRKDWRTRRTWPAPPHSSQVVGELPGAAPVASQVSHDHRGADAHRMPGAEHGLGEVEVRHHLQVDAAWRSGAGPSAAAAKWARAAEEGVEDVAETAPAEAERVVAAARGYPVGTEAVVAGSLLGVGQDLVGAGDLLEASLGRRIRIGVGVELACPLSVGPLDLVG